MYLADLEGMGKETLTPSALKELISTYLDKPNENFAGRENNSFYEFLDKILYASVRQATNRKFTYLDAISPALPKNMHFETDAHDMRIYLNLPGEESYKVFEQRYRETEETKKVVEIIEKYL